MEMEQLEQNTKAYFYTTQYEKKGKQLLCFDPNHNNKETNL